MKANQKMAVLTLFSAIVFSAIIMMGMSLSSYAEDAPEHRSAQNDEQHSAPVSPPDETTISDSDAPDEAPSNGKGAAKGCATGAAIGTAIAPGAGTLAGCIIVGIWGWFW